MAGRVDPTVDGPAVVSVVAVESTTDDTASASVVAVESTADDPVEISVVATGGVAVDGPADGFGAGAAFGFFGSGT